MTLKIRYNVNEVSNVKYKKSQDALDWKTLKNLASTSFGKMFGFLRHPFSDNYFISHPNQIYLPILCLNGI